MTAASWAALGVLLVLAGLLALARLRPARGGLTSPQWMLLLGALGMAGGLALDAHLGGLETLAALCSGPSDLGGMLVLHLSQLPLAHAGWWPVAWSVVPLMPKLRRGCRRQLCAQLGQNLLCSSWMVVGMAAGSLVFLQLAGWGGAVRETRRRAGRNGGRHGVGHGRQRQPGAVPHPAELRPAARGPWRALNPALPQPLAMGARTRRSCGAYTRMHCESRLCRLQYRLHDQTGGYQPPVFFG
jgi:hypothetical protein